MCIRFKNDFTLLSSNKFIQFSSSVLHATINFYFELKLNTKMNWTWRSLYFWYKNEIDYTLCSNRSLIEDIEVINNVNTSSDHRLLIAKLKINLQS